MKINLVEFCTIAGWIFAGAALTFILNHNAGLGAVIAASIVGLLGSFVPEKLPWTKGAVSLIYCGAFIGMSSLLVLPRIYAIIVASLVAAVTWLLLKDKFVGFGGKLGSIAFIGVAVTVLIFSVIPLKS